MKILPLLAVTVLGCAALVHPQPPQVSFKPAPDQTSAAAVDVAQVRVFDAQTPLPPGITREGQDLYADPAVPSPASPNRVLGAVKVVRNSHHDRATYLAAMQTEAAKHGANALILVDEKGERCVDGEHYCRLGYAAILSDTPATKFPSARAALDAWKAAHGKVGQPDGQPREVDLATTPTFELTPRRGECLTFVLALGEDAHVTRFRDRAVLRLQLESSYLGFNRSEPSPDAWGTTDRVLALDAGCAQGNDRVQLVVRNNLEGVRNPPGTGRAMVQVFKRITDERTLKQQAKSLDDADQRGIAEHAAMQQEACEKCYEEWRNCVRADPAIEKGQCPRFNNCVERRAYKPAACVMHRVQ